jgi:lysophospholipase
MAMHVPYDEENYQKFMRTEVAGWLKDCVSGSRYRSFDGTELQYYHAIPDHPKGTVVFVHGFCEFFGKFHEVCYDFFDSGYAVYFMEQRGHGHSGRAVPEFDRVHVERFDDYVEDLHGFLKQIVIPEMAKAASGKDGAAERDCLPLFLYAHSMGGAVSALFLEKYPSVFNAAVLSSPMLKMKFGTVPVWQVRLLMLWSRIAGWKNRPMPGFTPWSDKPDFEHSGSLSKARYDYQFRLRCEDEQCRTNGGTYSWGRAAVHAVNQLQKQAGRVKIPVLICQAGRDEWVDNEGQKAFAAKAGNARIVKFPEAKHEIYASGGQILDDYYRTVFEFFNAQAGV